jgi:hypothetical protein
MKGRSKMNRRSKSFAAIALACSIAIPLSGCQSLKRGWQTSTKDIDSMNRKTLGKSRFRYFALPFTTPLYLLTTVLGAFFEGLAKAGESGAFNSLNTGQNQQRSRVYIKQSRREVKPARSLNGKAYYGGEKATGDADDPGNNKKRRG